MAHTHIPIPPPVGGYRADSENPQFLLKQSRNIIITDDFPNRRPGFLNRRKIAPSPSGSTYLERIPLDLANGTLKSILHYDDDIVTDADSPSSIENTVYNPYGAITNSMPVWFHALGRTVWVANGTVFRVFINSGGTNYSLPALADAANPTLTLQAGGSMTATTWHIRVREYDNKTGTYSGPNSRTGTAGTVVTAAGNLAIKVDCGALNSRTTEWQVQLSRDGDTPDAYEISYEPKVSVGGAAAGDSVGRIPRATTTVYIDIDPTSGDQFEFRVIGALMLFRHANPPPADFVCFWKGRAFYASKSALWLVWSESDNPEHFYHDTSDPEEGFNTLNGESLLGSIASPCTALQANESNLYYFTRNSILVGEGSWALIGENRDARLLPVTQNSIGAISPSVVVKDQMLFFVSQEGLQIISGGVLPNTPDKSAVRWLWQYRNKAFDHRVKLAYDPQYDLIFMAFVSKDAPVTGATAFTDLVLAYHVGKQQWCAPFDMFLSSMTLHRFTTDGGVDRGTRLLLAGPYGTYGEWGISTGDGWDGSDSDANDLTPSAESTTSTTHGTKTWVADVHVGRSIVLTDAVTGKQVYRVIKDNSATVLTWDGAASNSGGGWLVSIGGIPQVIHGCIAHEEEMTLWDIRAVLADQFSRRK